MTDHALVSIKGTIRSKPIRQTNVTLLSVSTTVSTGSVENTTWHKVVISNDLLSSVILNIDDRIDLRGAMLTRRIDSRDVVEIRGISLELLTDSTVVH